MNTFELAVRQGALPETIEELVPLSFMGEAAVKVYTAKIKAMKALNIAEEQRAATLADGQDAGEMLIRIEARIGELCKSIESKKGLGAGRHKKNQDLQERLISDPPDKSSTKKAKLKEKKINLTRARNAEIISDHPEAIEEAIARAREDEDIPTRSDVINIIHSRKKEESMKNKSTPDINKRIKETIKLIRNISSSIALYSE
ncbi:MAG: hypothetical protein WC346_16470 [Methanogenium sp.]|jgi:hypothetical protein